MLSAFGVDHEISKKKSQSDHELIQAKIHEQHMKNRANKVEDVAGGVVGGVGAAFGLSALRNSYYSDYPEKKIAHEAKLAAMKPGPKKSVVNFAMHAKPRFPVYVAATGAGAAGFVAARRKKTADRRIKRYNAQLQKSLSETYDSSKPIKPRF